MDRRAFSIALGTALSSGSPAVCRAFAADPWGSFQQPEVDVHSAGAKGDGRTDDTAAIQRAISSLPSSGGSVLVPAGAYLINAVQSVRLRTGLTLRLAPDAALVAAPTGSGNYAILSGRGVEHVRIEGGQLRGERHSHLPPMSGEWGMGVNLLGCNDVEIDGVTIIECWGDGVYLGHSIPAGSPGGECRDIAVRRCRVQGNRRQGMSVAGCIGIVVDGCQFLDTGGTPPSAGIDLEPNKGKQVDRVAIRDSTFTGNAGWGLLAGGAGVEHVSIVGNRFASNGLGAVRLSRTNDSQVRLNTIDVASGPAVELDAGSTRNVVDSNSVTQSGRAVLDGRLFVEKDGATGNHLQPTH